MQILLVVALILGFICPISLQLSAQGIMVRPLLIEVSLAPGQRRTETITIENLTESDVRVQLTRAHFDITEEGTLDFLKADTSTSPVALHLSLPIEEVVIGAGETEIITLIIEAPGDETSSARWGGLFIESPRTETVEGLRVMVRHFVIILQWDAMAIQRQGLVTLVQVELDKSEEESSRMAVVSAKFLNTCLDILKVDGRFEIRDMRGDTVATEEIKDRIVLPEHTRIFTAQFAAADWPPGQYIALVIIDYGGETLTGGQWQFEVPEA